MTDNTLYQLWRVLRALAASACFGDLDELVDQLHDAAARWRR